MVERTRRRLLIVAPRGVFAEAADVLIQLQSQGAELLFATEASQIEPVQLPEGLVDGGGVSVIPLCLRRSGRGADPVETILLLAGYARVLDPRYVNVGAPEARISKRLRALGLRVDGALGAALTPTAHAWLDETLKTLEAAVPARAELEEAVAELSPDAMLLITRCSFGGFEPDAIKVARSLGIPSVMLVWSWDNLSSKAVLHEHPDHLLVWNETQLAEAVDLHGIPAERISVVGAPNFDRFFEEVRAAPRRSRSMGEPASILYLGSSPNIAADEPLIFDRWLSAVRASGDPALREAAVVVRPHPAALDRWRAWAAPPGVAVDEPQAKVDQPALARRLAEADVAVALNTSAEIEAAIAGCPVVTFRAGAEAPGQEGSVHFRYLLEENGGCVVDSDTLDDHVRNLAAVLRGEHDPAARTRFVERFVRPHGIDRPVSPIAASTILDMAAKTTPLGV